MRILPLFVLCMAIGLPSSGSAVAADKTDKTDKADKADKTEKPPIKKTEKAPYKTEKPDKTEKPPPGQPPPMKELGTLKDRIDYLKSYCTERVACAKSSTETASQIATLTADETKSLMEEIKKCIARCQRQ